MIRILYQSRGNAASIDGEMAEILRVSRRNNPELGITGLLLAHDGVFYQILEGEEENVDALLDFISGDRRHSDVQTLLRMPVERHAFDGWAMADHTMQDDCPEDDRLRAAIVGLDPGDPASTRALHDRMIDLARRTLTVY